MVYQKYTFSNFDSPLLLIFKWCFGTNRCNYPGGSGLLPQWVIQQFKSIHWPSCQLKWKSRRGDKTDFARLLKYDSVWRWRSEGHVREPTWVNVKDKEREQYGPRFALISVSCRQSTHKDTKHQNIRSQFHIFWFKRMEADPVECGPSSVPFLAVPAWQTRRATLFNLHQLWAMNHRNEMKF